MAKGKYFAFLDDDSYPDPLWLQNASRLFLKHPEVAALCGPCLTPPSDTIFQKASGLVWSSYLGSGGAGTYRNQIRPPRYIDDFPSVNLIVRKSSFNAVGGFQTEHWPGEDTLLCLDLTKKLGQKIYYHPSLVIYHHRRPVFLPHLKQISRYATHRGYFARIYPDNSRKIGYFLPSFLALYLLFLPFNLTHLLFILPLFLYLLLLSITLFDFVIKNNNLLTALLATISIPLTHVYYGILFLGGFFTPKLSFIAHSVNLHKKSYSGG